MKFALATRRIRAAVDSVLASTPIQKRSVVEQMESRLLFSALDGSEVVGLPSDMKTSLYTFIGDHSSSNSEKWSMKVGDKWHSATGFGEVQRDLREFKKGETYEIKLRHDDTNRYVNGVKKPDYDYRAWVDRYAAPAWTSGQTVPSGPTYFTTDPNSPTLIQKRWFGEDVNAAASKTAYLHIPGVDLDIDSDNDWQIAPDGTEAAKQEDNLEADPTKGKYVGANTNDVDHDGVTDFYDYDGVSGLNFIPIQLRLSNNVHFADPSSASFSFDYDAASTTMNRTGSGTPTDPYVYTAPSTGSLRLWMKNGSQVRSVSSDFIDKNTSISATSLGLEPGGSVTLFVEAVKGSTSLATGTAITVTTNITGSVWSGTLKDTIRVKPIDMNLTAYRTGGRLGEAVAESVENKGDPNSFLILTNDDAEQALPDGQKDYEDMVAAIPSGSAAGQDDDLAKFTLSKLPSSLTDGKVELQLSSPGSVRLFKADGTLLYDQSTTGTQPLTLYLGSASGYLSGLRTSDLTIWAEGLSKNSDFTLSYVYTDANLNEVAKDDVHMLFVEWKQEGYAGSAVGGTSNVTKEGLLAAVNGGESEIHLRDSQKYKIRIDGAQASIFDGLRVESDEVPSDYYVDALVSGSHGAVSDRFAVLYWSEDEAPLTSSERGQILSYLDLNAVHNQEATATATTQAGDVQARKAAINPRQMVLDRLQDEEDKHKNTAYYTPTGLNTLFPRLSTVAGGTFFTVKLATKAELGNAEATYTPGDKIMRVQSTLLPITAVHETIHAENERNDWHIGNSNAALRNDEALAWGIQNLLSIASALRRMESYRGPDLAAAAKGVWAITWGIGQNTGFPSLTNGGTFGYPGNNNEPFTDTDFWDVNAKYGIRFSAGALRPIYENVLAANGVTEADGSRIFLAATTIPAASPFA